MNQFDGGSGKPVLRFGDKLELLYRIGRGEESVGRKVTKEIEAKSDFRKFVRIDFSLISFDDSRSWVVSLDRINDE